MTGIHVTTNSIPTKTPYLVGERPATRFVFLQC